MRSILINKKCILLFVGIVIASCCKPQSNNGSIMPEWEAAIPTGSAPFIYYDGLPNLPKYKNRIIAHTSIYDGGLGVEDNRLCAVDLSSGKVLWFFPSNINERYFCHFDGKGYINGSKLVFQYQKDGRTYESSKNHLTVCVDANTGSVIWEKEGKSGYNSIINKSVVGDASDCFFVQDSSVICKADLNNDSVKVFYDADTLQINELILTDSWLALSCSVKAKENYKYNTYALVLDKTTGEEVVFCRLNTNSILANCFISNGVLYGNASTFIKAVDLTTKEVLWERDDPWAYIYVGMFEYNGVLLKCSENATTAYDVQTGEVLYYYDNYGSWGATVDGPYAYLVNRKKNIDVIEILTGKKLDTIKCKYADNGELFSGSLPTIYDNKLYMMSYNHIFRYPLYPWM